MKKKRLNEIVIFDQFLLDECKNDGKCKLGENPGVVLAKNSGVVILDTDYVCERHGPFFWLKKSIRKEAIELAKLHLRENKQKAYEVEKKDLEKLIKKKESRVRQKKWKKYLLLGAAHSTGFSWLTWN